jgi:hypothetical protein
MKTCTKCKIEKELTEFNQDKRKIGGLLSQCKSCKKEYEKNNKEKRKLQTKEYWKNNKENLKEKRKQYRENNKEKIKEYREKNKENLKEKRKEYYDNNAEKIIKKTTEYRKNNKEKRNKKSKLKRESDSVYKITCNIRNLIKDSIKLKGYKKNTKTELILGCTFKEFKLYLESKFESWMNWDNHGNPKDGIFESNKTWDIDHIIPISSAITEEDIIKLNHYSNLKPLCSKVNRFIKRNSLDFF